MIYPVGTVLQCICSSCEEHQSVHDKVYWLVKRVTKNRMWVAGCDYLGSQEHPDEVSYIFKNEVARPLLRAAGEDPNGY